MTRSENRTDAVIGGAGATLLVEGVNAAAHACAHCFPAGAMVNVAGKGAVPMGELQVGDEVEAMTIAGFPTQSRVDFFIHADPEQIAEFLCISTDDGRELVLTADHQVGVVDYDGGVSFMFAANVLEGMKLIAPMKTFPQPVSIDSIHRKSLKGIFAPCTSEGTIVVSGFGCSCYAVVPHDDAHQALALVYGPMTQFPNATRRVFHVYQQCLGTPGIRNIGSLAASASNFWTMWKLAFGAVGGNLRSDARCLKPLGSGSSKLFLVN